MIDTERRHLRWAPQQQAGRSRLFQENEGGLIRFFADLRRFRSKVISKLLGIYSASRGLCREAT